MSGNVAYYRRGFQTPPTLVQSVIHRQPAIFEVDLDMTDNFCLKKYYNMAVKMTFSLLQRIQ